MCWAQTRCAISCCARSSSGRTGSFSFDALVQRYNADLANGYGNLVSRTLAMTVKYFDGVVPAATADLAVSQAATATVAAAGAHFESLEFSRALETIWSLVGAVDGMITARAPWKVAAAGEEARPELASILYSCLESIRIITALVYPVLPEAAAKVWAQLGLGRIESADLKNLTWGSLQPGTKLGELGPIFPRANKDAVTRMQDIEAENAAPIVSETTPETPGAPSPVDVKPLPVSPAVALASAPARA